MSSSRPFITDNMIPDLDADFPLHPERPCGSPLALKGVRIVDFTHFIAGPFATMILADMGADVIKVEAPGKGDDFRQYPPVEPALEAGAPFVWSNRNKRSVALDLKTEAGLRVARELVAKADVVVENFSTGVMERFGLDHESCRKLNPKLIYCSVSAYGRTGAFKDRLGFDPVVQAESGFVSMNGYADREGVRALSPVMDISTAMMAANAILGALYARTHTGQGQAVEVALFDNALLMTGYATLQHLFTGSEPQRHGNTSPDTCPSGVFRAQDHSFYINCGNNKIFQRLMIQVVEQPDVAADIRFATGKGRTAFREELFERLQRVFETMPWGHWQQRMRDAGVPCGEVRTVGQAIRSPEARDRALVTRIPHPDWGWLPNVALPIRYSGTPLDNPRAAPKVGQHTGEVLSSLFGWTDADIETLAAAGAFGASAAKTDAAAPAEAPQ